MDHIIGKILKANAIDKQEIKHTKNFVFKLLGLFFSIKALRDEFGGERAGGVHRGTRHSGARVH